MIARGPTRLEISYAIAGNQQKSAEINRNQFEIRNQKSRRAPHYTDIWLARQLPAKNSVARSRYTFSAGCAIRILVAIQRAVVLQVRRQAVYPGRVLTVSSCAAPLPD